MTQSFGNSFCNARFFLPEDPWFDPLTTPPESGNESQRLQTLIDRYLHLNRGTLYLSTGDYEIHANASVARGDRTNLWEGVQHPDLLIPSDVTLMMAPGARLILSPGTVVRIDGLLDAYRLPIFIVLPATGSLPRGRVVILSDRIAELCPEWWGAESYESDRADRPGTYPQAPDTAQCLQDCFDAAHRHRVWPGIQKLPIPVVLQSVYIVKQGVVVDDAPNVSESPRNSQGLIVRGQRGPSTAQSGLRPNLQGGAPFTGNALITLRGLQGCLFEDVGFLVSNDAPSCVVLEGPVARGCTFRACSFSQGLRSLSGLPWGPLFRSGTGGQAGEDHSGLTFEGCYFSASNLEEFMVRLHASHSHPVVFDACQFQGHSLGGIRATAGVMLIQDSSFNTGAPLHLDDSSLWPSDIFLDAPSAGATGFAPACVATRIESQSYQLLKTHPEPVMESTSAGLPVVLEGVKHVNVTHIPLPGDGMAMRPEPASVRWGGPGIGDGAHRGVPLVMIGSTFGSAWADRLNMVVGREPAGAVVVDQRVALVAEVGCRHVLGHSFLWQFNSVSGSSYTEIHEMSETAAFTWLRRQ